MAALSTFTISAITASFLARIEGSSQQIGDAERFVVTFLIASEAEWQDFVALVTSKYHLHSPLAGNVIFDYIRGPGVGSLTITGLGSTTAVLIDLRRTRYLTNGRAIGEATFLRTTAWA